MREIFIDTPEALHMQLDQEGRIRMSAGDTTFVLDPIVFGQIFQLMIRERLITIAAEEAQTTPPSY